MAFSYTVKLTDRLLRIDTTTDDAIVTLLPFSQTPNAPYEIHKISSGDHHLLTVRADPATTDFLLPNGSASIVLDDTNNWAIIRIPANGQSPAFVTMGSGSSGGGGGTPDAIGPVTAVSASEVGTRYASDPDRLVHLTVGMIPVCPVPQPVTYLVSPDNGATWTWVGAQRMLSAGQTLHIDRLAPGTTAQWKVAAVAGTWGGDPSPIPDASLSVLYPGVVRSAAFTVNGLSTPATSTGITATIGACSNVISADGFTQYGRIPGLTYTDPTSGTAFFVRITVQDLDTGKAALSAERPYGGTMITGGSHTEAALLVNYVPGLAYVRYRFYLANRNSQGEGDFIDPATNTLQLVSYNGGAAADHYDVPIVIPPFTPIDPDAVFNVTAVSASEIGPKYQDEKAGLHTTIGVIAQIDHDYSSPRTVTLWFDFGTGTPVWQGWYSLTGPGQTIRIGDSTLGTDGVRKSGDIWVPANTAQGNWIVYCGAGRIDNGIDPTAYQSYHFTVVPVTACLPNGTTNAQFLPDPATSDPISYSKWDPGIWYWEYYCLTWMPPALAADPNYWFTLITVQKGATISGTWTPAPDSEGINEDPQLKFLGRVHAEIVQLPGVANDQQSVMKKFGARPATWTIPPAQNSDLSTNVYRDFRFLIYNVSRLGTDTSGSGGAGTYTLQTSCWPGGADHFILTPQAKVGDFDIRAANPATISLPLTGGNGNPLTVDPYNPATGTGGIGGAYLGKQSVQAINMAQNAITAGNQALAANAVVDGNVNDVGIAKVTYGTSVFWDVVVSRGLSKPVVVVQNSGIFLYGQADAATGLTGLTSKPYVAVQNSAIGLFQGGTTGGSVFLDGSSNAITIYNKNGDTTKPYFTVTSTGLSLVNGQSSLGVTSNALTFIDGTNNNRVDLNSAGLSIANGANKVVITGGQLQLQYGGQGKVTIDSTGIVVSNGGTAKVTVTASSVAIVNGDLSIVSGTVTIDIDATNYIKAHNSSSNVTCTMTGDYFIAERVMSPNDAVGLLTPVYLKFTSPSGDAVQFNSGGLVFLPAAGGSQTVIDGNMIYNKSVQTTDNVFGGRFGILVNPAVPTDPGNKLGVASATFTTVDGKTVTVTGGIVTSVV